MDILFQMDANVELNVLSKTSQYGISTCIMKKGSKWPYVYIVMPLFLSRLSSSDNSEFKYSPTYY